MARLSTTLRDSWTLSKPFWNAPDRWRSRGLLAVVIVLNLAVVGMDVLLTYWQRAFYNALEAKDWDAFTNLLFLGHTDADGNYLPGFSVVVTLLIVVLVYQLYLKQALQIRWRRWMTQDATDRWLRDRAYYRIALTDRATDNPDQRIAEDVRLFVDYTLTLGLGLMSAVVTLLSFIVVLWTLSDGILFLGVEIPGFLVWAALLYSVVGTVIAHVIGRRLIGLNFHRQRVEADFRYALIRVRDNAEGVALHRGEADEGRILSDRFGMVAGNWWEIMRATKRLTFFTAGFSQVANIFPLVMAAPAFFAGRIPLGGLVQTATAFGQVQASLSWIVTSYAQITEWRATVDRLSGFHQAVDAALASAADGPSRASSGDALVAKDLSLRLPDGRVLLDGATLRVGPGESVVVTGASGSGKSTLFRALAGIWPFGQGSITLPPGARVLFLPQRPYLPLGTLRRVLTYPAAPEAVPDAALLDALDAVGLSSLAGRLDQEDSWDRRLSGGEQQRLAFARALIIRPDWLFLDEATASLDPDAEERLYALLRERLPATAVVSIAHRPKVAEFHQRALRIGDGRLTPAPA